MPENFAADIVDWGAVYERERFRIPVRELCIDVTRNFRWAGWDDQHKAPIKWLEHHAGNFHFTDAEIWAGRTAAEMPHTEGVYFLFDGDVCIYIGQTNCFTARAEQHRRNYVQWTHRVCIEVPKMHAPAVEAYYIRRIRPVLNASLPNLTTYSSFVEQLGLDRAA